MKKLIYILSIIALSCTQSAKDTSTAAADKSDAEKTAIADNNKKHKQDVKDLTKPPQVKNEVQVGDTVLKYKVSLGVLPDLAYEGKGVKIIRVTKDRPGYYGGLKPGDIIIKVDDKNIDDLVEYTKILSRHKKGDSVILTVKRNNGTIKAKIVFD